MSENAGGTRGRGASSQQGAALLMMVFMMVIIFSYMFLQTRSSQTVQQQMNQYSSDNLAKAKEALLAHVVVDGYNNNQLGRFPCPDLDDYEGNAANNGTQNGNPDTGCRVLVGRLPYATIGLDSRDAVDGVGNLLWYAISRSYSTPSVNVDTVPELDVGGEIVATIFSPGEALSGQIRGTVSEMTSYTNYLEQVNGLPVADLTATAGATFPAATPSVDANDRWVTVSRREILDAIQRQLISVGKTCLKDYAAASGGKYPWAAPMTDTTLFAGVCNNYSGRFPFGGVTDRNLAPDCAPYVPASESNAAWCVDSRSVIALCDAGGGSGDCTNQKNQVESSCDTSTKNASCTKKMENLAECNTAYCSSWQFTSEGVLTTIYAAATVNLSETACQSQPASGGEDSGMQTSLSAFPSCTKFLSLSTAWRLQLLYHVSAGFVPGGSVACAGGTPCFSLNSSGVTDVQAVLAASGIALTGQTRATPAQQQNANNYLDVPNQAVFPTTNAGGNYVSIPNTAESASFNDMVVCPNGTGC